MKREYRKRGYCRDYKKREKKIEDEVKYTPEQIKLFEVIINGADK